MVKIVRTKKTTLDAINNGHVLQEHRPYLGMSMLAHPCERYLWYTFRWCYQSFISYRMQRLFNRGHDEEEKVIQLLKDVGIHVYGEQDEAVDCFGHVKGHRDGACKNVIEAPKTDHLLEIKTMNDTYFKNIVKVGLLNAKPVYYGQCYMYMYEFNLKRTLFIAVNKNDDNIYIERLRFEDNYTLPKMLLEKAESIILSEFPPDKKYKPTWYECKYCDAKDICHFSHPVEINCRTCQQLDLMKEGLWSCNFHGQLRSTEEQRVACPSYEPMECFR